MFSTYNPFTTYGCDGAPLFSTYVRWDGTNCPYRGTVTGLRAGITYRVIDASIGKSCSHLRLQEVHSGNILENEYNSVYFVPLPSGVGYASTPPVVGERFEMFKLSNGKYISWSTSPVIGFERISQCVWNVITCNTVYTVVIK